MMNITDSEHALKNYCKSKGYEKPIYSITSRDAIRLEGKTYREKHYTCAVKVNGQHLANGDGFSKRIARKKAAMFGLQNLRLMELNHLFTAFQRHIPSNALEYGSGPASPASSVPPFQSSVQIEELLDNVLTTNNNSNKHPLQIEERYKIETSNSNNRKTESQSAPPPPPPPLPPPPERRILVNNNADPSEDLILAAIAKLRNYDCETEDTPSPPPPPPPLTTTNQIGKTRIVKTTVIVGANNQEDGSEIRLKRYTGNDSKNNYTLEEKMAGLKLNGDDNLHYIDDSDPVTNPNPAATSITTRTIERDRFFKI